MTSKNNPDLRVNLAYRRLRAPPKLVRRAKTTSLSRRLTKQNSEGASKTHVNTVHSTPIFKETLVENTKILRVENDVYRLQIVEALLIV